MAKSSDMGRGGYWLTVLSYALGLAALVFLLKFIQYRYLIRDLSVEIYIGLVAVLFTALGVWAGMRLLRGKAKPPEAPPPPPGTDQDILDRLGISPRELDVLQLMAEGCSNQEIADRLFISLPTVKSHSSNLFVKLDVSRRTQAVLKAKSLGIIP